MKICWFILWLIMLIIIDTWHLPVYMMHFWLKINIKNFLSGATQKWAVIPQILVLLMKKVFILIVLFSLWYHFKIFRLVKYSYDIWFSAESEPDCVCLVLLEIAVWLYSPHHADIQGTLTARHGYQTLFLTFWRISEVMTISIYKVDKLYLANTLHA